MQLSTILFWLVCTYLSIGMLLGLLLVISKSGKQLIEQISYQLPITTNKFIWFLLTSALWLIMVSQIKLDLNKIKKGELIKFAVTDDREDRT